MVSATGKIGDKKSWKSVSSRMNGLKKKASELSTLAGIDVCVIILDPKQHEYDTDHSPIETEAYPDNLQQVHRIIKRYREYITTNGNHECGGVSSTTGFVGGSKKKRSNQDLIQENPAEMRVSCSSEQDNAWSEDQKSVIVQAVRTLVPMETTVTNDQLQSWEQVATAVPGFSFNSKTVEEELTNELMGFDQQNVKNDEVQRMLEELEELVENSTSTSADVTAASSSKFLVKDDKYIWPSSDDLNEILNGLGDGDRQDENEENMFDMPLQSLPPIPFTDAFIGNKFDSATHEGVHVEDDSINTSDKSLTSRMVEWDELFI